MSLTRPPRAAAVFHNPPDRSASYSPAPCTLVPHVWLLRLPTSPVETMARKSLVATAAALAVLAIGTVAAAKDEAVVSLTEKSFAETIAKEALVLVKFTVCFAGRGSRRWGSRACGGSA